MLHGVLDGVFERGGGAGGAAVVGWERHYGKSGRLKKVDLARKKVRKHKIYTVLSVSDPPPQNPPKVSFHWSKMGYFP
jgi:hypothetical protein